MTNDYCQMINGKGFLSLHLCNNILGSSMSDMLHQLVVWIGTLNGHTVECCELDDKLKHVGH